MLTIRPATVHDADVIVRFNLAIAWETEHKRLDPEVLTTGVHAILSDHHKGFYTVAETESGIVGQVLITYEYSDWRNGWFWWVQSVYVREDARRGGVFRSLFRHLQEKAQADPQVIGLRLYVERDNARAQSTYQSLGMSEEPYNLFGMYPLPGRESAIS